MKCPLIEKWLPGLELRSININTPNESRTLDGKYIKAADLERELEKAVVVYAESGAEDYSYATWIERKPNHSALKSEALLLGQRPLKKPRTATLTEEYVRDALKLFGKQQDIEAQFLDKLFKKERVE